MIFSHLSSVSISPITPVHPVFLSYIPISHPSLCPLQKQLMSAVAVLERRVRWLSSGSRQIWGTVCEQRYCRTLGFSPLIHSYNDVHYLSSLCQGQLFSVTVYRCRIFICC